MILVRLALRNLLLHKFKTFIVGAILFLGTVLVIVGTSVLDAIDRSMEESLVNSITAHIQLYSDKAKDDFQVFGSMDGSMPDVGRMMNFARVKKTLEAIDNVKTVVPMGIDFAVTSTSSMLERRLAEIRDTVRKGDTARRQVLKKHVRRMIKVLDRDLKNVAPIVDEKRFNAEHGEHLKALARALTPAFWSTFDDAPLDALEFLENEVGPISMNQDMIWVRYVGTDTALFARTFDRFEMVSGTMIPPGKRGFMFNQRAYERMVKNKTARRLDRIAEKITDGRTIARCGDCKTWIQRNVKQAGSLVSQFDDTAAAAVGAGLRKFLGSGEQDLTKLMKTFLTMDDGNFAARKKVFYDVVAPHITLYTVKIGDEFVLTGFAQGGGYVRKVPVKVYGTFRFRSLDRSPLAGGFCVMDIMTFRDLYGYMTEEKRKEQKKIRASIGIKDVKREDAESMFDGEDLEGDEKEEAFDEAGEVDLSAGGKRYTAEVHKRVYSKKELYGGVVVNAAVMLKDRDKLDRSLAAIRAAIKKENLGVKAVGWRKASGIVGQLITVVRLVLYGAVFIIFVVALIIVNNSLLMSTMERTREIGTMRAIGAQRGFVMRMFLCETGVLSLVFGGVGALVGVLIMTLLQAKGIPAVADFFVFLFAGPRLHPQLQPQHLAFAMGVIALVALLSTWYPAWIATRITPREAMEKEE